MNGLETSNPNQLARIVGFLYGPLMMVLGPLGIVYTPTVLVVPGDALTTAHNIMENTGIFRLCILTALIVQVTHLGIVLLLYKLLNPVNKNLAALMVIFMLVSIPITMLNEINHLVIPLLLSDASYLQVFSPEQLQAWALVFHGLHEFVINSIASIFWGLWLLPMGYLVIKADFISRIPGILLLVAGSGYLIDAIAKTLSSDYSASLFADLVSVLLFAEIVFPFWLLIRGVDVEKWRRAARHAT